MCSISIVEMKQIKLSLLNCNRLFSSLNGLINILGLFSLSLCSWIQSISVKAYSSCLSFIRYAQPNETVNYLTVQEFCLSKVVIQLFLIPLKFFWADNIFKLSGIGPAYLALDIFLHICLNHLWPIHI